MDSDQSTRREFCRQCSVAGLAALGGAVLGACGGGIQVSIDTASPLASPGSAALVQSPLGTVLVSRTGTDTFTAVTATCTHESCTITGFADSSYVCPCHGSRFDTSGRVLNGPASRALRQYQAQFANGVLTVTA